MKRNETSGNFDPMEGGLDAIMQAAVCPVSIDAIKNNDLC